MLYVDFAAGGTEYKLRLNVRDIVKLEKKLGCNPVSIMVNQYGKMRIPTVTEMIDVLHASLQQYHHGIKLEDAENIFSAWLEEGHSQTDFLGVIGDVFTQAGLISTDTEKN